MRNGGLGNVERRCEIADADRLLGVAEAERDLQAGRVGQRLQDFGGLFDLLRACLQGRRAADTPLALGKNGELFHETSVADVLTNVNGFASVASTLVYASEGTGVSEIQEAVRERYAAKALQMAESASCCDSSCCSDTGCGEGYTADELASVGIDPTASLGCGNPMLLADLRAGERVLDLGSGAGLDVLLSARRVAPGGHAYGVDMTDEMLAVARANQTKAAVANATFLKGTIEQIPLPDASVDVVISNCVINLAADKRAVLREAYRVLGPGGRFAVADMVALAALPAHVKRSLDQWAGCVTGTISVDEYTSALRDAGFKDVDVEITRETRLEGVDGAIASAYIRARKEVLA
jgi:arsenite methyltransferase